jgi:hypothetical protein
MNLEKAMGAILTAGALVVVTVMALRGDQAASGAMLSILSAGVGYYLRGKVQAAS